MEVKLFPNPTDASQTQIWMEFDAYKERVQLLFPDAFYAILQIKVVARAKQKQSVATYEDLVGEDLPQWSSLKNEKILCTLDSDETEDEQVTIQSSNNRTQNPNIESSQQHRMKPLNMTGQPHSQSSSGALCLPLF